MSNRPASFTATGSPGRATQEPSVLPLPGARGWLPTILAAAFLCVSHLVAQAPPFVQLQSPLLVGSNPDAVVLADLNGDGKLDIVAAPLLDQQIAMMLNNGQGGFGLANTNWVASASMQTCLAVGDLNGDGLPDLLVGHKDGAGPTLLQTYYGTRQFWNPPISIPGTSNGGSDALVLGDFNGDGKLDFASAGKTGISVVLGDGTGQQFVEAFSTALPYSGKEYLVSGDFNGDGKLDLAVGTPAGVTVLLGDGTGKFTEVQGSPFANGGAGSGNLTMGDFNRDNKLDLASAGPGGLTVLLGDGSGKFTAAPGSPFVAALGSPNAPTAVADFNGDGSPDVALANTVTNSVMLLLGDGKGNFTAVAVSVPTGTLPAALAVADLDGDGMADLVVANMINSVTRAYGSVTVLIQQRPITANPHSLSFYARAGYAAPPAIPVAITSPASGTVFTTTSNQPWLKANASSTIAGSTTSVAVSPDQASLAAGTYSGMIQFAASGFFGSPVNVTFHVTNPAGTLRPLSSAAAGSSPDSVAVADFNGDGKLDLAAANYHSNNVTVSLGDGGGRFTTASNPAVGKAPRSVAAADFNGDGKPDLAVANWGTNDVTVLLGDGTGNFTAVPGSLPAGCGPVSLAVGDFNGDGKPDLAVQDMGGSASSPTPIVLLGDGTGQFSSATSANCTGLAGKNPASVAVGDFNGDGNQDLVSVGTNGSSVTVLLGDGTGKFTAVPGTSLGGTNPGFVVVEDFNADGKQDLAIADSNSGVGVTLLLGDGAGGFTEAPASPFLVQFFIQSMAVGDFNGDGKPDLAAVDPRNGVTVLLGDGTGNFTTPLGTGWSAVGTVISSTPLMAAGDFNGDGMPDLAVPVNGGQNVAVLLGNPAVTNCLFGVTSKTVLHGAPISLNLTISPAEPAFNTPSGAVTFYDNGTPLGTLTQTTNTYTFTVDNLALGAHTLSAKYAGNARSVGCTSASSIVAVK